MYGLEFEQGQREIRRYVQVAGVCAVCWWSVILGSGYVQAESSPIPGHIAPMRHDSIKAPSASEVPPQTPAAVETPFSTGNGQVPSQLPVGEGMTGAGYDPSGRRDPFAPVIQELQVGKADSTLPPLQRVTLTELNLIAIVWGAYGYTAMVQTPEGHGYTVRRGTRIGQNNGVVSAVTERGIIVQERFTDVYGKKQEREHVKLLHPKEGSE
ncbi:MAG: pilus assembly protein PilP [Nitrospira sp.]|nr:pilus assembly protein PilP [Nitrospira sp.]MBS0154332.1 pilus assembly protein PilP [Nitrospira sp.]MBS0165788.1 pilus assembly protein PilP [Nitrospira sp.]